MTDIGRRFRYNGNMEKIAYAPAKTIVTRAKSHEWFGMDYNMNIYRGCSHGCIYCDSRSECYGLDDFSHVYVKQDALAIIESELRAKRSKGVIATGSMSDPYNPLEERLKLTRAALGLAHRHGFGVAIATKSALVRRDIDLLQAISSHSPVLVKLTITTIDETISRLIEPNAPSPAERLQALAELASAGIFCGILLMPVLPHITDDERGMRSLLQAAADSGARFVHPAFGVTMRDRQRAYFYDRLDESFPGLRAKYQASYRDAYFCAAPNYAGLQAAFRQECGKLGLLYAMPEIIDAYKTRYRQTQMTLF